MTWIKICGITNLEDALTAVDAGADALGFVFYEKSPRRIAPETARNIVTELPDKVEKVGVFVHGSNEGMEEIARQVGLTAIQVHIDPASNGQIPEPPLSQLKQYLALPAQLLFGGKGGTWYLPVRKRIDAIFLDSSTEQQPGGTGEVFDWEQAERMVSPISKITPIVVAGGLTPSNVNDAMRVLHPWGVDVSSGVEATPGKKDPQKIRAFIQAVRNIENN